MQRHLLDFCDRTTTQLNRTVAKFKRATLSIMNRLLKKFALWLLIVLLPLQGFAAIVHHSCDSGHVVISIAVASTNAQDSSASKKDTNADLMSASAINDECDEHPGFQAKKPSAKKLCKVGLCSSCASCCVGAVAPPVFASFYLPSKLPEVRHTSGVTLVIGFIPDSLERPPRYLPV